MPRNLEQIEESLRKKLAEASITKQEILTMAKEAADRHGVPLPVVLHALYKETGWMKNPNKQVTARSPAGALGVMQLMPGTAKYLGLKPEEIYDPQKNIDAGVRYLAQNLEKFQDPRVALAAYNAGQNSKRVQKFASTGEAKYLPKETRQYVSDYSDDVQQQLAKFYPEKEKNLASLGTDVLATATGSKKVQAALPVEHPVGTIVKPDWSKYQVGDLGDLEKVGPGRWRSTTGKIVTNAPELDKLPVSPKPETFMSKVKRALPPALGGGGELVSKVFGGDQKPAAADTASKPVVQTKTEPVKTAPPVKTEPIKAEPPAAEKSKVNVRKEFEKEFAKQRAALGPGETFAWTDPVTGKTGTFTTDYSGEVASKAKTKVQAPAVSDVYPDEIERGIKPKADADAKSARRAQDLERILSQVPFTSGDSEPDEIGKIIKTKQSDTIPDAPMPSDSDIEAAKARSQQHLADIDRELADKAFKESINNELQDILRLAGRLK